MTVARLTAGGGALAASVGLACGSSRAGRLTITKATAPTPTAAMTAVGQRCLTAVRGTALIDELENVVASCRTDTSPWVGGGSGSGCAACVAEARSSSFNISPAVA